MRKAFSSGVRSSIECVIFNAREGLLFSRAKFDAAASDEQYETW